ncbi:MAG: AMP-binding protein, partial [Acetobacteraceae bacterium]
MTTPDTLPALLDATAARSPRDPALAAAERPPLSYAALAAATRRMAEGLARQGIGPGDRVAIWLPNRPEFLVLLFALARRGATAILLNTRWRAEELARVLDRARPTAIAADWSFAAAAAAALRAERVPPRVAPDPMVLALDDAAHGRASPRLAFTGLARFGPDAERAAERAEALGLAPLGV